MTSAAMIVERIARMRYEATRKRKWNEASERQREKAISDVLSQLENDHALS